MSDQTSEDGTESTKDTAAKSPSRKDHSSSSSDVGVSTKSEKEKRGNNFEEKDLDDTEVLSAEQEKTLEKSAELLDKSAERLGESAERLDRSGDTLSDCVKESSSEDKQMAEKRMSRADEEIDLSERSPRGKGESARRTGESEVIEDSDNKNVIELRLKLEAAQQTIESHSL